jgi:hypothetical protein
LEKVPQIEEPLNPSSSEPVLVSVDPVTYQPEAQGLDFTPTQAPYFETYLPLLISRIKQDIEKISKKTFFEEEELGSLLESLQTRSLPQFC